MYLTGDRTAIASNLKTMKYTLPKDQKIDSSTKKKTLERLTSFVRYLLKEEGPNKIEFLYISETANDYEFIDDAGTASVLGKFLLFEGYEIGPLIPLNKESIYYFLKEDYQIEKGTADWINADVKGIDEAILKLVCYILSNGSIFSAVFKYISEISKANETFILLDEETGIQYKLKSKYKITPLVSSIKETTPFESWSSNIFPDFYKDPKLNGSNKLTKKDSDWFLNGSRLKACKIKIIEEAGKPNEVTLVFRGLEVEVEQSINYKDGEEVIRLSRSTGISEIPKKELDKFLDSYLINNKENKQDDDDPMLW